MSIYKIGEKMLSISVIAEIIVEDKQLSLSTKAKKNIKSIEKWRKYDKVYVSNNNIAAISNSDILFFSVQPSQFEEILIQIKSKLNDKHVIISTITGFKINRIA